MFKYSAVDLSHGDNIFENARPYINMNLKSLPLLNLFITLYVCACVCVGCNRAVCLSDIHSALLYTSFSWPVLLVAIQSYTRSHTHLASLIFMQRQADLTSTCVHASMCAKQFPKHYYTVSTPSHTNPKHFSTQRYNTLHYCHLISVALHLSLEAAPNIYTDHFLSQWQGSYSSSSFQSPICFNCSM